MNKRKFIKILMQEKHSIVSEEGKKFNSLIKLYDDEDYEYIDDCFFLEITKIYKMMYQKVYDSRKSPSQCIADCSTDPFCLLAEFWGDTRCEECFYGENHGICDTDQGNLYEAIVNSLYKRINDCIGYENLYLFFKWNKRII